MNNKDFDPIDKLAQEALQNFEADYSAADWSSFEQTLDAEFGIDQQAADAFESFQMPYEEANWDEFEQLLEKKKRLSPYMWGIKAVEAAVIALFVFTFCNLMSNSNKKYENNSTLNNTTIANPTVKNTAEASANNLTAYQNQLASSQNQNNNNSANTVANTTANENANNNSENTNFESNKTINKSTAKNTTNSTTDNSTGINNLQGQNNQQVVGSRATNSRLLDIATKKAMANKTKQNKASITNAVLSTAGNIIDANGINNTLYDNATNHNTTATTNAAENANTITTNDQVTIVGNQRLNSLLSSKELSVISLENNQIKNTIKEPIFELKNADSRETYIRRIHVGGTASVDANLATSMGSTGIGYGAGVFMDIELSKKVFLKTGLSGAYKSYLSDQTYMLDNVDGNSYTIDETKNSNLIVLQIPVDVQYILLEDDKWRVFVSAGATANIVASRYYDGSQTTQLDNGLNINAAINSDGAEKGALEGGDFGNNFYLSIGGGIGIERQLSENISLYLMPIYKQGILPTGINKDHISTFSFNVGIKKTLN